MLVVSLRTASYSKLGRSEPAYEQARAPVYARLALLKLSLSGLF